MNAHKRSATVLAISSILFGAASYAATIGPGQAEQQVADDSAILISTIAVGHDTGSTHRDRERAHRAADGKRSTEAGLDADADEGQLREQAAAQSTEGGELDVVLRSLPGRYRSERRIVRRTRITAAFTEGSPTTVQKTTVRGRPSAETAQC